MPNIIYKIYKYINMNPNQETTVIISYIPIKSNSKLDTDFYECPLRPIRI